MEYDDVKNGIRLVAGKHKLRNIKQEKREGEGEGERGEKNDKMTEGSSRKLPKPVWPRLTV